MVSIAVKGWLVTVRVGGCLQWAVRGARAHGFLAGPYRYHCIPRLSVRAFTAQSCSGGVTVWSAGWRVLWRGVWVPAGLSVLGKVPITHCRQKRGVVPSRVLRQQRSHDQDLKFDWSKFWEFLMPELLLLSLAVAVRSSRASSPPPVTLSTTLSSRPLS